MGKKSDLLQQLGWNTDLIEHFMIDDNLVATSVSADDSNSETFESSTSTLKYDTMNSETNYIYSRRNY